MTVVYCCCKVNLFECCCSVERYTHFLSFLAYFCVVFLSKFMTVRILHDSQKQFQLLPFFVNNYQKLLFCVLFYFQPVMRIC